ncbi:hypothetical protein ACVWYF_002060 [Hymenobacter sp. UYAg731]
MQTLAIATSARPPARAALPTSQDTATDILSALSLGPYKAVLVVAGSADSLDAQLAPKLAQFFDRAVAQAAIEAGALVVDGGTQAGVMELMGAGVASRGFQTTLLGVAPKGLVVYPDGPATGVALEPNHSHFVLVEGNEWGTETKLMYQLVAALAAPGGQGASEPPSAARGSVPAVVLLVGGGPGALGEMLAAVRQRRLIVAVEGSGGLADELAAAWPTRDAPTDNAALAEILAEGTLRFYPVSGSVAGLERLLVRELGANHVLLQAWETFADYDANANLQQKRFHHLQQAVILLGLLGTGLAIGQQLYAPKEPGTSTLAAPAVLLKDNQLGWWLLHHLLLLVPITLAILVTATNRFKQGSKWLLLRAGAEAIKREIYRYRTCSASYQQDAEQQLAQRIEEITRRTMRTEVNSSSLVPYDKGPGFPRGLGAAGADDDGLSFLPPNRYLDIRLGNQLAYFRRKAVRLDKQLKTLSWLTFIVGGIGTYLAAVGQQVWIALSTALVAAMGSYLGYRQTESTLTKYNQAATDLSNVRAWWHALPPEQQLQQANLDSLVEHTEQVLQAESDGWVQQMQNALADLHKKPAPASEQPETPAGEVPRQTAADASVSASPGSPSNTQAVAEPTPPTADALIAESTDADATEALTAEAVLPTEDTGGTEMTEVEPPAPAATVAYEGSGITSAKSVAN